MTTEIKKASDDELRLFIEQAQDELKARAESRREAAIEEIKRIAAAQHLQINFGAKAKKPKPRAGFTPKHDHLYGHPDQPDDPKFQAKGRGPKDAWWHKLIAEGREPVDLGTISKQDMKKAG